MATTVVLDRDLTKADRLILRTLAADIRDETGNVEIDDRRPIDSAGANDPATAIADLRPEARRDEEAIALLAGTNDPKSSHFEPTVFTGTDLDSEWPKFFSNCILEPYVRRARTIVRVETDVVMLTHLLLYFSTSVPSAVFLFWRFSWIHGILHLAMQVSYIGTYTLMMHQHIHMRGILHRRFAWVDALFPYITDPLMGHTWNGYYYHHVKHHHVEGNGPDDLSSTIRFQRDSPADFLRYVARFYFLIWLDLPLYFARKGRYAVAAKAACWELGEYALLFALFRWRARPTLFALLLPLLLLRLGLMVGNWGQHALVDHAEPDSDYRSSITLVDVPSNRHCFNDGYHTSHHLNPLRHWREHPLSFLRSKAVYARHGALVFHNIDYIMITVRLLMKDYRTLAECMVPIGSAQIAMTMEQRMDLLRSCTRRFTEEEIQHKFHTAKKAE
ncbi:hypothetical protein ESCO_004371 [Escovopsis weberi]|uniref:Fatty acid desaturase domain-containing protein n=1 Tax=Escovopsis weberi TaxID=150374 RepID=A0A0M9VVB1_ESCWE|nr:hypothetical protein ESCO_004371 [Escovopsis weberi]